MEKLKFSATVNMVLGIIALPAIMLLYLALSDIADNSTGRSPEWYVTGICMIILTIFIITTILTLKRMGRYIRSLEIKKAAGINNISI